MRRKVCVRLVVTAGLAESLATTGRSRKSRACDFASCLSHVRQFQNFLSPHAEHFFGGPVAKLGIASAWQLNKPTKLRKGAGSNPARSTIITK